MSETLKPCPFCGQQAFAHESDFNRGIWSVRCHNDPCSARGPSHEKKAWAIEAWNRRATPGTQESALREALERIVREWDEEGKRIKRALYPSSWEEEADYRRSQLHTILNVYPSALPPSPAPERWVCKCGMSTSDVRIDTGCPSCGGPVQRVPEGGGA